MGRREDKEEMRGQGRGGRREREDPGKRGGKEDWAGRGREGRVWGWEKGEEGASFGDGRTMCWGRGDGRGMGWDRGDDGGEGNRIGSEKKDWGGEESGRSWGEREGGTKNKGGETFLF